MVYFQSTFNCGPLIQCFMTMLIIIYYICHKQCNECNIYFGYHIQNCPVYPDLEDMIRQLSSWHQDYIVEVVHIIEDQELRSNLGCGHNPENLPCGLLFPTNIPSGRVFRTSQMIPTPVD